MRPAAPFLVMQPAAICTVVFTALSLVAHSSCSHAGGPSLSAVSSSSHPLTLTNESSTTTPNSPTGSISEAATTQEKLTANISCAILILAAMAAAATATLQWRSARKAAVPVSVPYRLDIVGLICFAAVMVFLAITLPLSVQSVQPAASCRAKTAMATLAVLLLLQWPFTTIVALSHTAWTMSLDPHRSAVITLSCVVASFGIPAATAGISTALLSAGHVDPQCWLDYGFQLVSSTAKSAVILPMVVGTVLLVGSIMVAARLLLKTTNNSVRRAAASKTVALLFTAVAVVILIYSQQAEDDDTADSSRRWLQPAGCTLFLLAALLPFFHHLCGAASTYPHAVPRKLLYSPYKLRFLPPRPLPKKFSGSTTSQKTSLGPIR